VTGLALALACLLPRAAGAQSRDPAAAEALFDDAKRLMASGHFAEACPKLEASQRIDPGIGTLLNLGDCLEKDRRFASAWARFREAASAALVARQSGREQEARARAAALEPRLSRLVVRPPAPPIAGLTVLRDDIAIDAESLSVPLPIDAGSHRIVVRAPGHVARSIPLEIGVADEGKTRTIDLPALVVEPPPQPSASAGEASAGATTRWSAQRTVGLVLGGSALVAAGVAGVLAIRAKQLDDGAASRCDAGTCDATARDDARSAGQLADGATVALVAAATLAVAAVVVYFTAPSGARPSHTTGATSTLAAAPNALFSF
jgi:hypothetical protein